MAILKVLRCGHCQRPLKEGQTQCSCGSVNTLVQADVNPLKMTNEMAQQYIDVFKQKAQENPKDTNAMFAMGLFYMGLKNYELAALSLLRDDKGGYERYSKAFSYNQYALGDGEKVFDRIYKERFVDKGKSAWLAAGLSAIVPGLGKMYVGCYGEGAASLLLGASFTGFAVESWVKNGGKDWRTILFTAAASLLHLSNIYGSYISVVIYDN